MKIVENRKIWFSISIAIIVIGLLLALVRGVNLGIDFTGGTLMEVELHQYIEPAEIREITDKYDTDAVISFIGTERTIVQIRTTEDFNNQERMEIFNEFKEKYNLEENEPLRAEQFGPAIGKEIQNRALISILISAIGMLIYITYRFEIHFGLAAITALLHDVLIVLAIYSILNIPINGPFVAAILTILGYSINDTIVVFDRVRENTKLMQKSKEAEIANVSISQTVTRSINTSVTTLITIVALYVLGVEQIKVFALPLIAGVISGTYSSIFIASPVWVMLKENLKRKKAYNANLQTK